VLAMPPSLRPPPRATRLQGTVIAIGLALVTAGVGGYSLRRAFEDNSPAARESHDGGASLSTLTKAHDDEVPASATWPAAPAEPRPSAPARSAASATPTPLPVPVLVPTASPTGTSAPVSTPPAIPPLVPPATTTDTTPIDIEIDDDDPRDRRSSSRKRKSSQRTKSGSGGTSDKPRDLDGMYPSTLRP